MALKKIHFSGSTDGRPIPASGTTSPGELIHTATSSTTEGHGDEIFLYGSNNAGASVDVTVQVGKTGNYHDVFSASLSDESSGFPLVPGSIFVRNSEELRVYASASSGVLVYGFVIRHS